MGKKHFMTIAAALFLGAGLLSAQRPGEQVKRDEVPMPTVHQDTLMKHVMELSSETYRGRLAGTEGYDRAVRYVKSVLQRYGLEQIEEMPFAVECRTPSSTSTVRATKSAASTRWATSSAVPA